MSSSLGDFGGGVAESGDDEPGDEAGAEDYILGRARVGEHAVWMQASIPIEVLRKLGAEPRDELEFRGGFDNTVFVEVSHE